MERWSRLEEPSLNIETRGLRRMTGNVDWIDWTVRGMGSFDRLLLCFALVFLFFLFSFFPCVCSLFVFP